MKNLLFATEWSGGQVWIQWDADRPAAVRARTAEENMQFADWMKIGRWPVIPANGKCRMKWDTHSDGSAAQVEVAIFEEKMQWEAARLAQIVKVEANFKIEAQEDGCLREGVPVVAMVRGEMASFMPTSDLVLQKGGVAFGTMASAQSHPFNELDFAGEFSGVNNGLLVVNTGPSTAALIPVEGRKTGIIRSLTPDGPFAIHIGTPFHTDARP